MGLFGGMFVEEKKASKTTYSQDDIKKMELQYANEFRIEKEKRALSPYRKLLEPSFTARIRDYAMEKILDNHLYTFKHLLVIPNPYGMSRRTAMLLFNSSKLCSVEYSILDEKDQVLYTGKTEVTDRHRVFVSGLAAGMTNRIRLELKDKNDIVFKRRKLTIYIADDELMETRNIPTQYQKEEKGTECIMITGMEKEGAVIMDETGRVCNVLENGKKVHYRQLDRDLYLYGDTKVKYINKEGSLVTFRYHLVDAFGRIRASYLLEDALGRAACRGGDSLFLTTQMKEDGSGNEILELSLSTGEVVKRKPVSDLYSFATGNIRKIRKIQYIDGFLYVMVVGSREIVKYDWNKDKMVCHIDAKKISGLSKIRSMEMFVEQGKEFAFLQGESTLVEVEFSEEMKPPIKTITTKNTLCNVSIQISENHEQVMVSSGRDTGLKHGWIQVFSMQTGKKVCETVTDKVFSGANFYMLNMKEDQPLVACKNTVYGTISSLQPYEGELPPLAEKPKKKGVIGRIFLQNDILLFSSVPGCIENMYFKGENHCYVQKFGTIKNGTKRKITFAIPLLDMEYDEYYVYIERNGTIFRLKNEIRIASKDDMMM